ncbi:MAG: leucyl aminopeptidase [Flavobacteriales bacterium]|nr:leucyl aminopeptidase [Flavobacteriales bacterium]
MDSDSFALRRLEQSIWVIKAASDKEAHLTLESLRKKGASICGDLNTRKRKEVHISGESGFYIKALVEGLVLSNYQFHKYKRDKKEKGNSFGRISIDGPITAKEIKSLKGVLASVYETRDLVNEPLSFLTAPQLGKEIKKIGKSAGFKVEVMGRKKIESLKMGGLLAVNRGSVDDPSFSILEWKPSKAKNKKPIVLVGKGVVYDTGGLSLKPTPNSMDLMKSDMAGAAMMIGTMAAISRAELPLHVIALIPATDNRPGGNAYAPGDVVTMYDGTTVEVWNTDAEGRMLLADALSYAKKFDPELVINSATLTGAAIRAIGTYASCVMGTADNRDFDSLERSGYDTYERAVRMPFWEEYRKELDSDIADIKNLGGANAGQITAGKFLEHFTDYPWIHIDIAGPSFLTSPDSYRGKWATGYGVRLLFDMLSKRT